MEREARFQGKVKFRRRKGTEHEVQFPPEALYFGFSSYSCFFYRCLNNVKQQNSDISCEQIFNRAVNRLKSKKNVSDSDKADIIRFIDHLQARNNSKRRATKYVYHLIVLARTASKSLGQLNKEDVETLVGRVN